MKKPQPGQKWHLPDLDRPGNRLITMIGDHEAEPGTPLLNELSLHFYRLEESEPDLQRPHLEDELYYVLQGQRTLEISTDTENISVEVKPGDVVYVPKKARHRFVGSSMISLLVFFAPSYTGPEQPKP
jgi:mannose-6-phosphate isomerase-like protein (cupin superfamily)